MLSNIAPQQRCAAHLVFIQPNMHQSQIVMGYSFLDFRVHLRKLLTDMAHPRARNYEKLASTHPDLDKKARPKLGIFVSNRQLVHFFQT
jgi:hypothetical protein